METIELGQLIAKYGINNVHLTLMNRMKNDYLYLKKVFDEKKVDLKNNVEKIEKIEKIEKNHLEKVKEEKLEICEIKNVIEEAEVQVQRTPKEFKLWQKEQEEKKYAENKAKGIKKVIF